MKNHSKVSRFTKQERLAIVGLIESGKAKLEQISARRKIHPNTIRTWLQRYGTAPKVESAPAAAPAAETSTALVPAGWPIKAQANGQYLDVDKDRVHALVDKEKMSCADAAQLAGIPVATLYAWRHKRKTETSAQVVLAEPKHVEVEIEPGVAAVVVAAQQALVTLRQARESRLDAIRSMQSGSNVFTDDFCLSQIALNKLNRVFGMK